MGYGVAEADAFPAQIAYALGPGYDVVNGAVAAYSTDQEVTWFLETGRTLAPDVVVLELYWNDLSSKAEVAVAPDGALISSRAVGDQRTALDSPLGYAVRNLLKRSRLLYVLQTKRRQLADDGAEDATRRKQLAVLEGRDTPEVAAGWATIERELARLAAACRAAGLPLLVVVLPMPQQLGGTFPHVRYQSVVREMCARQGLDCLDLLPAFEAAWQGHESLFIAYDGDHPNEAGHALVAREVVARLTAPPPAGLGFATAAVAEPGP
jgi:lysophospholipase L1-like esterase